MKTVPTNAQYRALHDEFADVEMGNRDGIPTKDDAASVGLGAREKTRLGQGLARELAVGIPLSQDALSKLSNEQKEYYAAMKSLQATLTSRKPADIGESKLPPSTVTVSDPVSGKTVSTKHEIFYQRWNPPAGIDKKDVLVISPAYQATGRWWSQIADGASRQGSVALAMDHGFAGLSAGKEGRFDGPTLAAETALMLQVAAKEGGPVRMVGESLGAASLLCGVLLAYNGKTSVPVDSLPKGPVYVAMVNPYLGKFSTPGSDLLGKLLSPLPFSLPAREFITNVIKDGDAEKRFDQKAKLEDIQVHPSGLIAAQETIQNVISGIESGALKIPSNVSFGFLLSREDASIDRNETERLLRALKGSLQEVKVVEGKDHAVILNKQVQPEVVKIATASLSGPPRLDAYRAETPAGIKFTEDMHGRLKSTIPGVQPKQVKFTLTIETPDTKAMVEDPKHFSSAHGHIDIFGERCEIKNGEFELFAKNEQTGIVEMRYRLKFKTADGASFYLQGTKFVHDDPGFDLWSDTTTLFTEVRRGDENGPVVLNGKLRLNALDLAKQLTTFRSDGDGPLAKAKAFARFFGFFGVTLKQTHVDPKFGVGK